jgi:hypothetical protein
MNTNLENIKQLVKTEVTNCLNGTSENKIKWLQTVLSYLERSNEKAKKDFGQFIPISTEYRYNKKYLELRIKLFSQFLIDTLQRIYSRLNQLDEQTRASWDYFTKDILSVLEKYEMISENENEEVENNNDDNFYDEY